MAKFEISNVLHFNKHRLKFFSVSARVSKLKLTILNRIKFNQEILTKFLKRMHQLSINLLCSSDYQTAYSFCEIKHFFQTGKGFINPFSEVTSEKYHMFHHKFSCLKSSLNYSLSPGFWQSFISIEVCRECIPALASSCKKQLTGFFVCLLFFLKVKRIS